ncbi:MAG: response regulator transcription factor [Bryobacteraceae bacterium]|nr:response regulator transcription factor [Bryobacteraceae bacterium]
MTELGSPNIISVLCVDDHPMLLEGLRAVIDSEPDMRTLGLASSVSQALDLFVEIRPDVVLMDLRLGTEDGVDAIRQIRQLSPKARIIALTTYSGDEVIHQALEAGAAGYLLKDMLRTQITEAIRTVYRGHRSIPPAVAAQVADHLPRVTLTDRELEVLKLVSRGLRNKEIAYALALSEGTVKVHIANVLSKLNVQDRTHAVVVALDRGILRIEE